MGTTPVVSRSTGSALSAVRKLSSILERLFPRTCLTHCEERHDVMVFELRGTPASLISTGAEILARVEHKAKDTIGEREVYYLLRLGPALIRFSTFQFEDTPFAVGYGAVYQGPNPEAARFSALRSFRALRP